MFLTRIWEVTGLNLGRTVLIDIDRGFSQFRQSNTEIMGQ
jgi:hypothetical protein